MTRPDPSNDASTVLRAAADVLIRGPLEFGAKLVEDPPSALDRARRELSNARFMGRLAVSQGVDQLRARIENEHSQRDRSATAASVPDRHDRLIEEREFDDGSRADGDLDEPSVDDLALPDYDTLPAIDIVAKLATLEVEQRAAVERYERAHRQRRTVLGKLDLLAAQ